MNNCEDRLKFLISVRKRIIDKFGSDNYNVFISGSFLSDDDNYTRKLIGMIVDCSDREKAIDIICYLNLVFEQENLYACVCSSDKNLYVAFTDYFADGDDEYRCVSCGDSYITREWAKCFSDAAV